MGRISCQNSGVQNLKVALSFFWKNWPTLEMLKQPNTGRYLTLMHPFHTIKYYCVNPLKAKLNPICHLLALLEAHHILHVSRVRVKLVLIIYSHLCLSFQSGRFPLWFRTGTVFTVIYLHAVLSAHFAILIIYD